MSTIQNNMTTAFIQATDIIVEKYLQEAKFTKTVKATIISLVDKKTGRYKVRYQDNVMYAYSKNGEDEYESGDSVYVLIPEGDFSSDKTILGTTSKTKGGDEEYVIPEKDKYEIIGSNIFTNASTGVFKFSSSNNASGNGETQSTYLTRCFEVYSDDTRYNNDYRYYRYNDICETEIDKSSQKIKSVTVTYDNDVNPGPVGKDGFIVDLDSFNHNVLVSNYLVLSADISSFIPSRRQGNGGNFGIEIIVQVLSATGEAIQRAFIADTSNMIGNPFNLGSNSRQTFYFPIAESDQRFQKIVSIKLFAEGFSNTDKKDNEEEYDITFSNLSLTLANRIPDESLNGYYLQIATPQGNTFGHDTEESTKKSIKVILYKNMKDITTSSQSRIYWFVQNAAVNSKHKKYCVYGGEGWECLNKTATEKTDDGDSLTNWVSADKQIFITKSQLRAKENTYKCVVVYDNQTIARQVTMYNDDAEFSLTLATSDNKTVFYKDAGTTNLIATLYDHNGKPYFGREDADDIEPEDVIFEWYKIDYLNRTTLLKTAHINEKKSNSEMANVLPNIKIAEIVKSTTFVCSAIDSHNNLMASKSIVITNSNQQGSANNYELIIVNKDQIFKYDENGVSPSHRIQSRPQAILPLYLKIFNNTTQTQSQVNGNSTTEPVAAADVKVFVPVNDTLITFDDAVAADETPMEKTRVTKDGRDYYQCSYNGNSGFVFNIKDKFNASALDNTIRFEVTYNKRTLVGFSNLTFIKTGQNGTNGTDFVFKILPNYKNENDYADWPYAYITEGGKSLSYYPELNSGQPFKRVLYRGSTEIDSNVELSWRSDICDAGSTQIYYPTDNAGIRLSLPSGSRTSINEDGYPAVPALSPFLNAKASYREVDAGTKTDFYAAYSLPLVEYQSGFEYLKVKILGGFKEVMYNPDGTHPSYDSDNPFKVEISGAGTAALSYYWRITGMQKVNGHLQYANLLTINGRRKDLNLPRSSTNSVTCRPVTSYTGECRSVGLECTVKVGTTTAITITIPIYFYLNRYGNAAINGWDGNSVSIIDDQGEDNMILSPQVGAGEKNEDNTFTGMVMGKVKWGGKYGTGLYGFVDGEQSFSLDAYTGKTTFGKQSKGQIIIDPSDPSYKFVIKGSNFKKSTEDEDGTGLQIDFSDKPAITYGSGNFSVDSNGNMTAHNAKLYDITGHNGKLENMSLSGSFTLNSYPQYDENGNVTNRPGHMRAYIKTVDEEGEEVYGKFVMDPESKIYTLSYENEDIPENAELSDEDRKHVKFMRIDLANGVIKGGQPVTVVDKEDPNHKEVKTYSMKIDTKSFRFGDTDQFIEYKNGDLKISGTLDASLGSIAGWEIGNHSLTSPSEADEDGSLLGQIKLFSGNSAAEEKINKYAHIDVDGDYSYIATIGKGGKAVLRRGGLYFYRKRDDAIEDGWQGRIYTNEAATTLYGSKTGALTMTTQGTTPILFFGADVKTNDEGKKLDSLICSMYPSERENSTNPQIIIGSTLKHGENYFATTLKHRGIEVENIFLKRNHQDVKLSTIAQDVVGAINEIYPGGNINIQHAVVVSSEEAKKKLYEYETVLYKTDHTIGYQRNDGVIIASGLKLYPNCSIIYGQFPDATMSNNGWGYFPIFRPQKSATFVDDPDRTYFYRDSLTLSQWQNECISPTSPELVSIINGPIYSVSQDSYSMITGIHWVFQNSDTTYTSSPPFTRNTYRCICDQGGFENNHIQKETESNPLPGDSASSKVYGLQGGISDSPKMFLTWSTISCPGTLLTKTFAPQYGFVKVQIYYFIETDEYATVSFQNGGQYIFWKTIDGHQSGWGSSYYLYIPFASQAEYEAAVGLISKDPVLTNLYKVNQTEVSTKDKE